MGKILELVMKYETGNNQQSTKDKDKTDENMQNNINKDLIMTLLSFFSLLFYCIYYSDIRVKAISRIIKNDNKDELKVATDV